MLHLLTWFWVRISLCFSLAEARDLIIQLLDPVPETRITLKEVIKHPWLRPAKKYFLNCETVAANSPVEVNQNIVLHMADNMGLSMREVVNSVKQNRYDT